MSATQMLAMLCRLPGVLTRSSGLLLEDVCPLQASAGPEGQERQVGGHCTHTANVDGRVGDTSSKGQRQKQHWKCQFDIKREASDTKVCSSHLFQKIFLAVANGEGEEVEEDMRKKAKELRKLIQSQQLLGHSATVEGNETFNFAGQHVNL